MESFAYHVETIIVIPLGSNDDFHRHCHAPSLCRDFIRSEGSQATTINASGKDSKVHSYALKSFNVSPSF